MPALTVMLKQTIADKPTRIACDVQSDAHDAVGAERLPLLFPAGHGELVRRTPPATGPLELLVLLHCPRWYPM